MDLLPSELQDPAILRRIIFAAVYLPSEMPHYWNIIARFASQGGPMLQSESVKLAVDNLQVVLHL